MEQIKTIKVTIAPGQHIWELNLQKGEVNMLGIHNPMRRGNSKTITKKIVPREHCLYCSALGKETALQQFAILYEQGIADGTLIRPEKDNKKNALESYLCLNNNWEPEAMAIEMFKMITDKPSEDNAIWPLLEATGDSEYTRNTFLKAAHLILQKN